MDLKATIAPGYRFRLILITLAVSFFCAFFFYDGFVRYPKQKEVYDAFAASYKEPYDPKGWAEFAKSQGWSIEDPKERTQTDINLQRQLGAFLAIVSVGSIIMLIRWSRMRIEADENGIRATGGRAFTWDQVTKVDAHRWDKKGIARVYYDAGSGERSLLIDDWKLERKATDAIFDRLCENIDPAKIEGLKEKGEYQLNDTDSTTDDAVPSKTSG